MQACKCQNRCCARGVYDSCREPRLLRGVLRRKRACASGFVSGTDATYAAVALRPLDEMQRSFCREWLYIAVHEGPAVQEASSEWGGSQAGTVLSESGARTLLPYYMDCIHSPTFKAGSLNGACEVLHKPSNGNWKAAWDVFRQMDTLQIDASRCEAFVDVIAPELKSRAGLQPFAVKLRPQSTDHDVFLQVQLSL